MRVDRRHHIKRIKAARKSYWGGECQNDERLMGKLVNTPHPCSCFQCMNIRRATGEQTMREKKSDESIKRDGWEYF